MTSKGEEIGKMLPLARSEVREKVVITPIKKEDLEFLIGTNRDQEGSGWSPEYLEVGRTLHTLLTPGPIDDKEVRSIINHMRKDYPFSLFAHDGIYQFIVENRSFLRSCGFTKGKKLSNGKIPDLQNRRIGYSIGGEIKTYNKGDLPLPLQLRITSSIEKQLLDYLDHFNYFLLFYVGVRKGYLQMYIYQVNKAPIDRINYSNSYLDEYSGICSAITLNGNRCKNKVTMLRYCSKHSQYNDCL